MQCRMPFVEIQTNQDPPGDVEARLSRVSELSARVLSKPESYVMTRWAPKVAMTFAGSNEPCAMVRVALVGSASPNARSTLATELTDLLDECGVSKSRVFVTFSELSPTHWGLSGSLFG